MAELGGWRAKHWGGGRREEGEEGEKRGKRKEKEEAEGLWDQPNFPKMKTHEFPSCTYCSSHLAASSCLRFPQDFLSRRKEMGSERRVFLKCW